jgi:hypothetical protein
MSELSPFHGLAPMLLNEVQKQQRRAAEQIRALQAAVVALQASHQSH